ncbi:ribosome maturation factor RimM [Planctomonas sp. JC2975]|uniref:ribosome maturation factor RimM n=1 Tax=Planctomonas sp. JC2975 TaxID=2729626 RepID=UPI00147313B7|nr:ribosome maturation factor RimM [Planctomonas sp. JC2975]NNC10973.1 ribosome maturation factor RimM [Planctomonas sp. JC2975]
MASASASISSTDAVSGTRSEPNQPKQQLRVGRLTKAHGLKGAIKLELFTDDPEHRFVPGAEFSLQVPSGSKWHGKTLTLAELRWYNGHAVGFFEGVGDRTEAETLVKAILWVDQDDSVEEDAWYDHQLVGLRVLRDGVEVGTIARVDHLPAQDLLAVKTGSGEVLVPFVSAIVPEVDVKAGTVTVTPPTGLFEEIPETDDDDDVTDDSASEPLDVSATSAEPDEAAASAHSDESAD